MTTRRSFLLGLTGALAAPAVVRAESLMKIWVPPKPALIVGWDIGLSESSQVYFMSGRQFFIYNGSKDLVTLSGPGDLSSWTVELAPGERRVIA